MSPPSSSVPDGTNRCSQINWQFRVACHSNYLPTVYHTLIIQTFDNCSTISGCQIIMSAGIISTILKTHLRLYAGNDNENDIN